MWGQIAIGLKSGDLYLYIIAFLTWLGLTVMLERMFTLQFVYNLDFKKFLRNLRKMIQAEDWDRAVSECKKARRTSLPLIALRGLEANEVDPTTVRGTLEEETLEFIPRIEARLSLLPAAATAVLFIGVIGTMDRLWTVFTSVGVLDTADKQAALATGVSTSLVHTTVGLLCCMMLLIGHHLVRGLASRLIDRVHHGIIVVTNLLAPATAMAAYMPAPQMMPAAGEVMESYNDGVDAPIEEDNAGGEATDAFDDAAVDDIKDEEEII